MGPVGCGVLFIDQKMVNERADSDGDGVQAVAWDGADCDDTDAEIHPEAEEICDGKDNDCDGTVDGSSATDASTWYRDNDGDGFGDAATTEVTCSQPSGFVADDTDCDDMDPNATTTQADGDCDGTVYADDCDDEDSAVHPGAEEVCDGLDNNCDGEIDEETATGATTWYADMDSDGYGDAATVEIACNAPAGFVSDNSDCEDGDGLVHPGAEEVCDDFRDNDCDGTVDGSNATDASTWYQDSDADGYGDASISQVSCSEPTGFVSDSTDCDDTEARNNPGAEEKCDSVDNNCDGTVDEDSAADALTWYADADGDTYGEAGTTVAACSAPSGYVADGTDCADTDAAVNPGATEYCDSVDNNCDGTVDDDSATDALTWYADADGDTFGDATTTTTACQQPGGFVSNNTDCNDASAYAYPFATEICDGLDNNCDNTVDEDTAIDASSWYGDADGDGYGHPNGLNIACDQPTGFVSNGLDCNDGDAAIHPAATEVCDSVDNNCVDGVDEGNDADNDGYDDLCDGDCNDADSSINPGEVERCDALNVDEDCDGLADNDDPVALNTSAFSVDSDGDGYGHATNTEVSCDIRSGLSNTNDDCDDTDAAINPGASELCSTVGVDDDCDGEVDEDSAIDAIAQYPDSDGDGYGLDSGVVTACTSGNSAPTFESGTSSPGSAINDWTTVTDDISLTGCGSVDNVTVDVDISHSWRSDLDIQLTGPDGTTIGLWQSRGDFSYNLVATFTDSGSFNNDYGTSPLGDIGSSDLLSTFDGGTSTGTWTLTVNDTVSDDDGTLNSWGVNVDCGGTTLVTQGGDCDESDASINPGATELFGDGEDNDCDGTTDNLDLVQVDTASWTPTSVYGPRVSARSEGVYVTWATDSYQDNSTTLYDGAIISTYNPTNLAAGPTSEIALGSTTDQGTLGEDFDFGVDDTYFYMAKSLLSNTTNELTLSTVHKTTMAAGETSSTAIGGSQTYEDVKLFLMENTSSGDFVSAVGCGADGMDAVLGNSQNVEFGTAYTAANTSIAPSTCSSMLRPYSSYSPFFESYYYAWDASQTNFQQYYFNTPDRFGGGNSCSTCQEAVDLRHWRNNGYRVSAHSVNQSGTNLIVTRAGEDTDYWSGTRRNYLVADALQSVDVDATTSGTVYACGVGSTGVAWLHTIDITTSSAPTSSRLGDLSVTYDDCSISISENNVMSVAVRSGTDIYISATTLP